LRLENPLRERIEERFALREALLGLCGKRSPVKVELANLLKPACELLQILVVLLQFRKGKFALVLISTCTFVMSGTASIGSCVKFHAPSVPGYSPLEVEQRITFPMETAMAGLPRLDYTRSLSRYGLSQVTVVFKDGTDIYFARQLVNERIQAVKDQLPSGAETQMGPIATGLGEIYHFVLEAKPDARKPNGEAYSPTDLRTMQEWIVKPRLRSVPGVIEVNTIGGYEKQFHVLPQSGAPDRLQSALPRRDDGAGGQ
jgi:hypothetical protein